MNLFIAAVVLGFAVEGDVQLGKQREDRGFMRVEATLSCDGKVVQQHRLVESGRFVFEAPGPGWCEVSVETVYCYRHGEKVTVRVSPYMHKVTLSAADEPALTVSVGAVGQRR